MIELINKIERFAGRNHVYCEDPWYNCPKSIEGCADDRQGDECNCGADVFNAKLTVMLQELKDKWEAY